MKRLALLAILLLSGVVAAQQFAGLWPEREAVNVAMKVLNTSAPASGDVLFAQTFAVREGDRLDVDLRAEHVKLRPARGLEATVTVRGSGPDARRDFERSRFSAAYRGGVLSVRTDPPRRWQEGQSERQVVIEVPVRFSATVDVGSGSVRVERLSGDLTVDTGSGDITVGTARGRRIRLHTGSGDVTADLLEGDVEAETGSGNVRVDRAVGALAADTGSGDVSVGEADVRAFEADTGSGAVTASLVRAAETEIDTGSGRVRLTLPAATDADVELRGRPIRVDRALAFSGDVSRREMSGRLGAGGPEIEVSTGSGGITLRAD